MLKIRRLLISLIFVFPFLAQAEETFIFCAHPQGDYWYWPLDENEEKYPIEGEWDSYDFVARSYFHALTISQEQYRNAKRLCRAGDVPQPADGTYSKWHIFRVKRANGSFYFAPGSRSNYRSLEDSFQLRV